MDCLLIRESGRDQIGKIYMRQWKGQNVQSQNDTPKTWDDIPGYLENMQAKPWKFNWICQRPTMGSRWYRGNFTLGFMVDSHPRFVHLILGLIFIEVGLSWKK